MRLKYPLIGSALFAAGLAAGGWTFSKTIPRTFLMTRDCGDTCLRRNEVYGVIASIGLQRFPGLVPGVVMESDTCLAIRHPKPDMRVHYVLFPKHDTKNVSTLTDADVPYVLGCFAMTRSLVERDGLKAWRVSTNGPGVQEIAYLHFHLLAP